jgi:putative membrane protein
MMARVLIALGMATGLAVADNKLTDEQSLEISMLANQSEVDAARLVPSRASSAAVKQFAETMLIDHSSAKHDTEMLLGQLRMAEATSALADELKRTSQSAQRMLEEQHGRDFDRAYIDGAVKSHTRFLRLLDEQIIPAAKDPAVRKLFTNIRPVVEQHLKMATRLQAQVANN